MAAHALLIEVRLLDGRYHGLGDWPPSPFRLFAALIAGAYGGRWVAEPRHDKDAAFRWLEGLRQPEIAAPHAARSRATTIYVPNNDLDSVGGDPGRIAEIRGSTKQFIPWLFEPGVPLLYAWRFEDGAGHADRIAALAERLHALGRGIDTAFARAEVVAASEAEARLLDHGGPLFVPGGVGEGERLACPTRGSFLSLVERHAAETARFSTYREGRTTRTSFRKAPNARAVQVAYARPSTFLLFELRGTDGKFKPQPVERALVLTLAVRDRLVERLSTALPGQAAHVLRYARGDRDAPDADKALRLRFLALPSIGHAHAGLALRRLAVEIPSGCPLRVEDVTWGLSGLDLSEIDGDTGEILRDGPLLVPASDRSMLGRYVATARRWRTVTPVALPVAARTGRRGDERLQAETLAAGRLADALRHAGRDARGTVLAVRREPFHADGVTADRFAGDRFGAGRLAHAEIVFPQPIAGPLVLGDGRFLGLGLFAPVDEVPGILAFGLDGDAVSPVAAVRIAAAARRAVMARVRDALGLRPDAGLPLYFSGHAADGAPARTGTHDHLFVAVEPGCAPRLLVVAPHCAARREATRDERSHLATLERALDGFERLVAGRDGAFGLVPLVEPAPGDRRVGPSSAWISATAVRPTRHPKRGDDPATFLAADIAAECAARGLPAPERIEIADLQAGPRGGLAASVRLTFAVAVAGPILLGRDAHQGGGLFLAE
jgi:CRISPR-associated protein Csb2